MSAHTILAEFKYTEFAYGPGLFNHSRCQKVQHFPRQMNYWFPHPMPQNRSIPTLFTDPCRCDIFLC